MKPLYWYLAGLVTLPVLAVVFYYGLVVLGIGIRAIQDTVTITGARHWQHIPQVLRERTAKQWEAYRGGYGISAMRVR